MEGGCLKRGEKGAWTVSRFKAGGGEGSARKRVVFLIGERG